MLFSSSCQLSIIFIFFIVYCNCMLCACVCGVVCTCVCVCMCVHVYGVLPDSNKNWLIDWYLICLYHAVLSQFQLATTFCIITIDIPNTNSNRNRRDKVRIKIRVVTKLQWWALTTYSLVITTSLTTIHVVNYFSNYFSPTITDKTIWTA